MKKLLIVCLISVCAGSLLFAGGQQGGAMAVTGPQKYADADNVTPPGTFPIVKNKITLEIMSRQDEIISDFNNNHATEWLEKKLGIDINWIVATDGYMEKRNVLLSSGNYPDGFMSTDPYTFSNEDLMKYGSQGVLIPLNRLIEQYGDEIKKVMAVDKQFVKDMYTPEGQIYGLPVHEMAYHMVFPQKMWINSAWLKKLGMKMPETTEEFREVLRAFKNRDPNGNGKADEIPITGAINYSNGFFYHYLMNSFIYCTRDNYFYVDNNHHLQFAPIQNEWRDGLAYMKSLFDEKLFETSALTQTQAQLKQITTAPGPNVAGAVAALHPGQFVNTTDTDPRHLEYEALPPLKGPKGVRWAPNFNLYRNGGAVITDRAKNPATLFRFCDYLYSEEGTLVACEGVENEMWRRATAGEKDILGRPATYTRISYALVLGAANNYYLGNHIFRNRGDEATGLRGKITYSQDPTTVDGYEVRLYNETKNKMEPYGPKEFFTQVFLPSEASEDVAQLKVNIESFVNQSIARFITGQLDPAKDWDNYVKQLKNMDVDRYLKYYADAYQKQRAGK